MGTDFHAAALIYTAACCSQSEPGFSASWPVIAVVSCISIVYNGVCSHLVYGSEIPPLFQQSIALYLTWSASSHWGLSIKRGSSKPRTEAAMAWAVLAVVLCWFLWIPDWIMCYVGP